ncbi:hypothetical protein DFH06DRAFT_1318448 [Mycena polygramma]|nr:hypothetical protein DFH06DRAFT_1325907 [Mycena polygramma]KAJ7982973.1 hypothetical protein DFH06DRAFT_1318448 [Mycena polygramma]
MTSAADIYPPGYLNAIARPFMISDSIALPLFGIGVAQTAYYFRSFQKDPILIQIIVGMLFTYTTIFVVQCAYATRLWFLSGKNKLIISVVYLHWVNWLEAWVTYILAHTFNN